MARICLVACVSLKDTSKMRAGDIYLSPLFKKAKEYAINNCDRWYILSAKYGLIPPDAIIKPYEKTLNKMRNLDLKNQEQIKALAHSIVQKILHEPTIKLREEAKGPNGERYAVAVSELFGLNNKNINGN